MEPSISRQRMEVSEQKEMSWMRFVKMDLRRISFTHVDLLQLLRAINNMQRNKELNVIFLWKRDGVRYRGMSCVCMPVKEKDHHSNVNNKRICKDGPVFLSTEVEI